MWSDEHLKTIELFVCDVKQRIIMCFVDSVAGFTISTSCPVFQVDELHYFIRKENAYITSDFSNNVQHGKVRGSYIDSLLRMMTSMYAPMFFHNATWPDSILCLYTDYIFSYYFHHFG